MKLNNKHIDLSSPRVMTIVNVTPDSFYDGSRTFTEEEIERHVERAIEQGTDMLDVGGYSSRPNADEVSVEEEIARVGRAMRVIRRVCPEMVVSIDTFRAEVVRRTVAEWGDCIVNDISAGELDPQMITTVAELGLPYVAMHMRGTPATMQSMTDYDDIVEEVHQYFAQRLDTLREAGIEDVVIDPGFGFAKTLEQNYQLMNGLGRLSDLDAPILVGISRKSMIYKLLGCTPAEALNGTTALHLEALRQGAKILRVHDTREAVEVVKIYNQLNKNRQNNDRV
ncbi:MAG: dihydropteroate synthase [Rikenellaceae bacterium]|nr:dihydropteroate synthase [Rikenellaceae bacterium]